MFGAWRTALLFSLANLVLLRVRIRSEEQALESSQTPASSPLVTARRQP
jgi:isoprenylcysteine carboxyl methyltransferase (ICMT) family protein YpbQ